MCLPSWIKPLFRTSTQSELLVFVSSTGDLALERQQVRRAIDRVNGMLEEAGFRERMRPIMWEDLPPGEAPDGDFQAFIESLLKQFGRDRFAIYLGFAKRRLGSKTPRFPSGTVEEFEDSLAGRKKSGWPREVLFYFIADSTPERALLQWKTSLASRGYLYQDVTSQTFSSQTEQALYDIASTWNLLRVRVRRMAWALLRPTLFVAAALLVFFVAYTIWASWRTYEPLSQSDFAGACERLQSDARFMWIDPFGLKNRIDRSFAEAVRPADGAEALLRNLDNLATWQSCRTEHEGMDKLTTSLANAVRDEVAYSDDDVALLRKARGVSLFTHSPDDWRILPRMAAARRLFDLHISGADDPFERLDNYLSPAERQAVKTFADGRQSSVPAIARALVAASGDETQIINAILKLHDRAAGRFVISAVLHLSPDGRAHLIEAVWPTASGASTQEWLSALIADAIVRLKPADPKLLANVVVRLRSTGTPITLQAIADSPGGIAAAEFQRSELDALLDTRNFKWLRSIALLASDASNEKWLTPCETVVYTAQIMTSPGLDGLPESTVKQLESIGFARLTTEESLDVALINLFGRARSNCLDKSGQEPFVDLLQRYADGRTSFGFAQKAALIEAFADAPEKRDLRLAIVSRALDEAASLAGDFAPDPEPVENAWFESLTGEQNLDRPEFIALLERIIDRRAKKVGMHDRLPLGRMLMQLPDARVLALLRYPTAPLLDPPWSDNWPRRDVLIGALSDYRMSVWGSSGRPMPEIANSILGGLPADESESEHRKVLEEQAWRLFGGDTATVLGEKARAGDRNALRLLANLWPAFLVQESGLVPALNDAALADVVSGMNDRANSSCADFPKCSFDVSYELRDLLWMRSDRFRDNEPLRIQLFQALAGSLEKSSNEFNLRYTRQNVAQWIKEVSLAGGDLAWLTAQSSFFGEEPWLLLEVWRSGTPDGAIDAVASALAHADEIDWLFLTQNLIRLSERGTSSSLWPIASAKRLAVVAHRSDGTLAIHGLPLGDEIVANPFIASYAIGDARPADVVTQLLPMIARADLLSDATVGSTATGPQFGGFLRWALARVAERGDGACLPSLPDPLIGLDSSHPAIRAGEASLAIAARENLMDADCRPAN